MKVYILMFDSGYGRSIWSVYATEELREAELQRIKVAHEGGARVHPLDFVKEDAWEVEGA